MSSRLDVLRILCLATVAVAAAGLVGILASTCTAVDSDPHATTLAVFLGAGMLGSLALLSWRPLVLFALLSAAPGCQLGPKGRAAVVAIGAVKTIDGLCDEYLKDFEERGASYYNEAIAACAEAVDLSACATDKVKPRQVAMTACRVYGGARLEAARGKKLDLEALGRIALGDLEVVGWRLP